MRRDSNVSPSQRRKRPMVLKYFLMALGILLFGSSGALLAYDIYLSAQLRRLLGRGTPAGNTRESLDLGRTGNSACAWTLTAGNVCPTCPPAKTPPGGPDSPPG